MNRESWALSEWNSAFAPVGVKDTDGMSQQEIEEAAKWLTSNRYPVPIDCPINGCPEYRVGPCIALRWCKIASMMVEALGGKIRCSTCEREFFVNGEFKNEVSVREFRLSGMCQACQDKFFGKKG